MAIGAIGYRGYMWVYNEANTARYVLPYTREDITEKPGVLLSDAIAGGGTSNSDGAFASRINAATGQVVVDGTVSSYVFGANGNFGKAFKGLVEHALFAGVGATFEGTDNTKRASGWNGTGKELVINPGGGIEFLYPRNTNALATDRAVVERFSLRGNLGNFVEFDAGIWSTSAENRTPALVPAITDLEVESTSPQQRAARYDRANIGTEFNNDDANPLPYYRSDFRIGIASGNQKGMGEANINNQVVDWTVEIANNPYRVYSFNGANFAVDIIPGWCIVSGSFNYYSPDGTFIFPLLHGAPMSIYIGEVGAGSRYLRSEYLLLNNPVVPAPAASEPVVRTVAFECLVGYYPGTTTAKPSLYVTDTPAIIA